MTPNATFGRFTHNPQIELLDDGRSVRVVKSFAFTRRDGSSVRVPAGFVCDGASIPRILWPLSGGPFEGKHRDAALVHDYLYARHRAGSKLGGAKEDVDQVFYEAMRACGVSRFHAWAKWLGVTLFGWRAWGAR